MYNAQVNTVQHTNIGIVIVTLVYLLNDHFETKYKLTFKNKVDKVESIK